MNEYLGDDPCVSGNFKKKFIEVTNWITNAFYNRINTDKLNELFSYDILDVAVKSKVLKVNEESNKMLRYSTWAFRNWKNLCYLINELTSRTSLIEVAFESLKDNGIDKKTVSLERPYEGLYIANYMWREMFDFSSDAVLMVLASELYDEADYIRDYDEFLIYTQKMHLPK